MIAGARHGSAVITTPSDLEIRITRQFDAPAGRVFRAWTQPRYVRRWWGFEESPLVVCDIDLRVGGGWRYVTRDPDGTEMMWSGEFCDIVPDARLVSTEVFEDHHDGATLNTLVLHEAVGVTTLTITVLHRTPALRDGQLASGMERGLQHGLDRIDGLLAEPEPEPESEPEPEPHTQEPTP